MSKQMFVHNRDESPRMFKSDFLDLFSRVHFSVPFFLYAPVVLYFSYCSLFHYELSLLKFGGLLVAGAFLWTLFEYCTHRFIFHYHPTSEFGKRIHFLTHGVHHDYPNDSKRLVMPPPFSIPIAIVTYFLFTWLFGGANGTAVYAGFVASYVFYDLSHYAIHHLNFDNRYFKKIQAHHLKHHYVDPDNGYGFTSDLWDKVFQSEFEDEQKPVGEGQHV